MKSASIRDLRYRFPEIERMLRCGETIEITRRGKPVGHLSPATPTVAVSAEEIMARLRRIHGNKIFKVSNVELLRWDRGYSARQPRQAPRRQRKQASRSAASH